MSADAVRRIWTIPNVLSFLRLATVPVFVVLFLGGREAAAVVLYAVGAWTDFFDGVIARRLGQVTELGKLLDPLADRVFIAALIVVLVAEGHMGPWPAAAVLAHDVLILVAFPFVERRAAARIPVSFVGKTATAALLFGLTWLAAAAAWDGIDPRGGEAVVVAGAILYWVAAALYARAAVAALRGARA